MKNRAAWVEDLFILPLSELQHKYGKPKDERSLKQLQRYYKGQTVEKQPTEDMFPERTAEALGRLASTWEVITKNNDGEAEVHTMHKYEYDPQETVDKWEPVAPANIRPTRRKVPQRDFKYVLVYGDGQVEPRRIIDPVTDEMTLVDTHNEPALRLVRLFNAYYMPETTVNLGDFADMSSLSRFPASSDHFHKTLGPAMRYIHDFYAQMRADNPKAEHVEIDSNHAIRPKKQVLANIPSLYDFVRPGEEANYPMLTYYYMANLGKLSIKFVSGYGGAEYVYGEEYNAPPIVFKHGNHSSSSPGATVRKEAAENPTVHVIRGHGHNDEEIRRTTREGHQLIYKQLGTTCLNNGLVEGYRSAVDDFNQPVTIHQNHQNTIMMIRDYGNGRYEFNTIDIIDGRAYFEGKEFNGNE